MVIEELGIGWSLRSDGSAFFRTPSETWLKHRMPKLDRRAELQVFQHKQRSYFNGFPFACTSFEAGLLKADEQGGTCKKSALGQTIARVDSKQRWLANNVRKKDSFEIRRISQVAGLKIVASIAFLFSQPERHPTRWITDPRHPSDFADMLGALFAGNVVPLRRPVIAFLNQFNESKLRKRKMNADLLRVFPTTCFKTACIDWWTVYTDLNCTAGICSNTWQTVHRNKEEVIHHYTYICQIQGAIQVHSSRPERCQSPSKRELKRLHTISRCSIKSPYYTSLMHHLPDGVHELNDIHLHVSLFLVSVLWIWSFNWNLLCPPTKNKVCCTTLLQAPSTRIAMSVQVLNIVKASKLFLTVVLFGVRSVLSFCPDFFLSINIRALDYVVET